MAFGKSAAQIQEEAQKNRLNLGGGDPTKAILPKASPQPIAPAPTATAPSQKKVGFGEAFLHGTPDQNNGILQSAENPYDPNYKPTFTETLATAISPATAGRKLAQTLLELHPDVRKAREAMDNLRAMDQKKADELELNTLGKKKTTGENIVVGTAAAAELALNFIPFFIAGKGAVTTTKAVVAGSKFIKGAEVVAEGANAAIKLSRGEKLAKLVTASGKSAGYGALYGGLYNLHQYDADWEKAVEGALWGGVTGAAVLPFASTLGLMAGKAKKAFGAPIAETAVAIGSKIKGASEKYLPMGVHTTLFSTEAGFSKIANQLKAVGSTDVGEYIASIPDRLRNLDAESKAAAGRLQEQMIDLGVIEAPTRGAGKTMGVANKYAEVGGNKEKMRYFTEVLEGKGAYKNPAVQAEAISRDPVLKKMDEYRKAYFATSQEITSTNIKLNPETYVPHHTANIPLEKKYAQALSKAKTAEERLAIFESSNAHVKEMIDYSVDVSKKYKDKLRAYEEYYDYMSFVQGDGRVLAKDNKFFQGMVERGEVKTRKEAEELLSKNNEARRKALTGRSSSLDYDRQLDLPWYDPDAGRVMSTYSMDAITRINYAKEFGAQDEKLWEAIKKVRNTSDLGRDTPIKTAEELENIFRIALGTEKNSDRAMAASQFIRALQVPKLTFSAIVNLGQTLNNILVADMPSAFKGLQMAFTDEGIRKAIRSGALTESFLRQASDFNTGGGNTISKFMKANGFNWSEVFNRTVGANVSDKYVTKNFTALMEKYKVKVGDEAYGAKLAALSDKADQDIAKELIALQKKFPKKEGKELYQLAKDKTMIKYPQLTENADFAKSAQKNLESVFARIEQEKPPEYWALKELGIDIKDVLSKGYMDAEDKAMAAFRFVEKTQFTGNPLDLPSFASSPVGKVVFQFKSFSYQQSKLALGTMKNQFARGQYKELAKTIGILGTVFPMGNAALKDLRSLITQEKRPTTAFDQWWEGLGDAASFGLLSDFISKSESGQLASSVGGVSVADGAAYLEALTNLDGKKFLKQAGKNAGLSPVVNFISPNSQPGKSSLDILRGRANNQGGGDFSGI